LTNVAVITVDGPLVVGGVIDRSPTCDGMNGVSGTAAFLELVEELLPPDACLVLPLAFVEEDGDLLRSVLLLLLSGLLAARTNDTPQRKKKEPIPTAIKWNDSA
jgi:hypothetical protein